MATSLPIPVFPVRQQIGTYFTGVVSAHDLLEICRFDFRRIHERGGRKEFLGIQRELKESRIKEISKYIRTADAVFPTSIVISVDERCAQLEERDGYWLMTLAAYEDPVDVRMNIPFDSLATIIDGQHRLAALHFFREKYPEEAKTIHVPCMIFDGQTEDFATEMFVTINSTPTRINKSHLVDLYEKVAYAAPDRKLSAKVCELLYAEPDSPLQYKVNRLGGRSRQQKWILQAELFNEVHRWVRLESRRLKVKQLSGAREIERTARRQYGLTYRSRRMTTSWL